MATPVLLGSHLEVRVRLGRGGQKGKNEVSVCVRKRRALLLRERRLILRKDDGFADAQLRFAHFFDQDRRTGEPCGEDQASFLVRKPRGHRWHGWASTRLRMLQSRGRR